MPANDFIQIALFVGVQIFLPPILGSYTSRVFSGESTCLAGYWGEPKDVYVGTAG